MLPLSNSETIVIIPCIPFAATAMQIFTLNVAIDQDFFHVLDQRLFCLQGHFIYLCGCHRAGKNAGVNLLSNSILQSEIGQNPLW